MQVCVPGARPSKGADPGVPAQAADKDELHLQFAECDDGGRRPDHLRERPHLENCQEDRDPPQQEQKYPVGALWNPLSQVFIIFYQLLEPFKIFFIDCRVFFPKRMKMLPRFSKMQESLYKILHAGSMKFLNFIRKDPCVHVCA